MFQQLQADFAHTIRVIARNFCGLVFWWIPSPVFDRRQASNDLAICRYLLQKELAGGLEAAPGG
jgi:hypothetical protein